MAYRPDDPYNIGIGTPDLGNINMGQVPVNNMYMTEIGPGQIKYLNQPITQKNLKDQSFGLSTQQVFDNMPGYEDKPWFGKNQEPTTAAEFNEYLNSIGITNESQMVKDKKIGDQTSLLPGTYDPKTGIPYTADLSGTTGTTTLSGNFGVLSENADISRSIDNQVIEYENEYMKRTGKVPPMFYGEKKRMELQIKFLEEQKRAAGIGEDDKPGGDKPTDGGWKPTYNPASSHAEAQATGGDYHGGHQSTVDGQTTDWGPNSAMIARGGLAQYAPRGSYFNGGLASLYRHGGF
jgi:hypothetical protein